MQLVGAGAQRFENFAGPAQGQFRRHNGVLGAGILLARGLGAAERIAAVATRLAMTALIALLALVVTTGAVNRTAR